MNVVNFTRTAATEDVFGPLDDRLDFDVLSSDVVPYGMHPTDVVGYANADNKVLYRETATGAFVLGVVGSGFPVKSHREFFEPIQDMLVSKLPGNVLDGATVSPKVAHGGAFGMLDITFPNSKVTIETRQGWKTDVAMRLIAWHGLAGSHSNNTLFGCIDFFCTNGMIGGEYNAVKRKNTKNFDLKQFVREVERSVSVFYVQALDLQVMATTHCSIEQGNAAIDAILGNTDQADRKINRASRADKMRDLWLVESQTRGANVFALASAFTNYSSHTNNGFALRETGADHGAVTMLSREVEVTGFLQHPAFTSLLAA